MLVVQRLDGALQGGAFGARGHGSASSLKNEFAVLCETGSSPSSGNEAKSWIAAPDSLRINLGVVPATRPREISDGVSLSDKERREVRAFVPEKRALDPLLLRDGVVDVVSPNENSISCVGSQDDMLTRTDELAEFGPLVPGAVVPPV